ncbi:plasmid recombination protein [Bariatricus sp. HCP28S3_A7]|uniref:plasmid recombination protein n=1 Tax=Bariatricus sp. HCP28S3_A7 TaxID=3438894 RepID=UPI003F8903FC
MGDASYTAHVSNRKSAITSKSKLKTVANHNLRKYRSSDYSRDNILLLYGTENLYKDVQEVYHREFDEAVRIYNENQKRKDRKIDDYFEHVSELNQDMAVEIIFQCGDKEFWEKHGDKAERMEFVYRYTLRKLQEFIPEFKVANAVIHFDEASPHMHVVGVPVYDGYKKGLSKRVSKRNVFTQEVLSGVLQDKLRSEAEGCFKFNVKETFAEKKQGRNRDLSVLEYKVAKESEKLETLAKDVVKSESSLAALSGSIAAQNVLLEYTQDELEEKQQEADRLTGLLEQIKQYVGTFRLFAPTIEEYAISVEKGGKIEAGNSYRGILNELGQLLERFKELIREGLCWFPRLMRWKTSVGEVAPIFKDTDNGYSYLLYGYMNVETREQYLKEDLQSEIIAEMRVRTVEQMDANIVALERDLAEILRLSGEQRRLWEAYEK